MKLHRLPKNHPGHPGLHVTDDEGNIVADILHNGTVVRINGELLQCDLMELAGYMEPRVFRGMYGSLPEREGKAVYADEWTKNMAEMQQRERSAE